jgi:hypothetical protein
VYRSVSVTTKTGEHANGLSWKITTAGAYPLTGRNRMSSYISFYPIAAKGNKPVLQATALGAAAVCSGQEAIARRVTCLRRQIDSIASWEV